MCFGSSRRRLQSEAPFRRPSTSIRLHSCLPTTYRFPLFRQPASPDVETPNHDRNTSHSRKQGTSFQHSLLPGANSRSTVLQPFQSTTPLPFPLSLFSSTFTQRPLLAPAVGFIVPLARSAMYQSCSLHFSLSRFRLRLRPRAGPGAAAATTAGLTPRVATLARRACSQESVGRPRGCLPTCSATRPALRLAASLRRVLWHTPPPRQHHLSPCHLTIAPLSALH